jgi:hypothetical protein
MGHVTRRSMYEAPSLALLAQQDITWNNDLQMCGACRTSEFR